jgi:hypothetical protein
VNDAVGKLNLNEAGDNSRNIKTSGLSRRGSTQNVQFRGTRNTGETLALPQEASPKLKQPETPSMVFLNIFKSNVEDLPK